MSQRCQMGNVGVSDQKLNIIVFLLSYGIMEN